MAGLPASRLRQGLGRAGNIGLECRVYAVGGMELRT
jgi:hypothetical protein